MYLRSVAIVLHFVCQVSTVAAFTNDFSPHIIRIETNIKPVRSIRGDDSQIKTIEQRMQELNVPGLSVAVAVDGKLAWAKAWGYADISEQRKVSTDTLFRAASISKPITALRVMQLAQQHKLELDADVNNYLTKWQVHYNVYTKEEKVTARRLLNHTAGITVWGGEGYPRDKPMPTIVDILYGRGSTPAMQITDVPGEKWRYANGGYNILQLLTMELDNKPFPELMHQYVLAPLGMTSSTFDIPLSKPMLARAATGYWQDKTPVQGKWEEIPEMAAGGLWSTPTDLLQYAIHIQNSRNGRLSDTQTLLNSANLEEMLKPGLNEHGLGPVVFEHTFFHNGSVSGFKSQLYGWHEHDVAIVAMTNSYDETILDEYVLAVATEFGLPGIAQEVFDVIDMSDTDKQKFVGTYDIPELGKLVLSTTEKGLLGTPDFYDGTYSLYPESPHTFFNIATGTRFKFEIVDGGVTGFSTDRVTAVKL